MGYNVRVSDSAERDTDEIIGYLAERLMSPRAAVDFADALEEKYSKLEENPFIFELSRSEQLARKGYRRFVVGSYVALYLVDEDKMEVTIARVFYGKRNYEKYI